MFGRKKDDGWVYVPGQKAPVSDPLPPPPPAPTRNRWSWPPWWAWVVIVVGGLITLGTVLGDTENSGVQASEQEAERYRERLSGLMEDLSEETSVLGDMLGLAAFGNATWVDAVSDQADEVQRLALRVQVLEAPDDPEWDRVTRYLHPAMDGYYKAAGLAATGAAYADVAYFDDAIAEMERANMLLDEAADRMPD